MAECDAIVSAATCLSGDELQWASDSTPGLLAYPVPPAAQQGPAHQPSVHFKPGNQPGRSLSRSTLLSLCSF